MHTRASNSELVEPLLEPERTLNRRRHRRNRRLPYDQSNNPPQHPKVVYPPILDINHFSHFLVTLENLYPIDDERMWAADHVVALTPGSAITIPKTANEFSIKGNALKLPWSQSVQRQYYPNLLSCIDVIDEILEENFDVVLDEGSKILHSIKGTLLDKEILAKFDEFMVMTADKNSDSEFDTEELPFEKNTITNDSFQRKKDKLVSILKRHKQAFAWKRTDIPGICPSFCKHKIQLLDDKKPVVQKQRRLNPNMQEVVRKEIVKLLDTVVTNKTDELVPTRTVLGWRVLIDYPKLNEATAKDYFPLPFMDQMLERPVENKYLCFLDGFLGIFKFLSILMIKRKQHSHVLSAHTLIGECLLVYATLPKVHVGNLS
uniref:Reverse transcriptase domain-containing protein n=1 Tax=Tanacetum cinerariifolium TaxID=118510 RepID=A0A6L2M0D0_TANCI|nr:reverse transcriptase domain-containing protein [Tanacetum cinerariifolium]